MTGALLALLGVLAGLGMTVVGDMVSEEVRDRLDHLPHAILRLAARRLKPAERTAIYEEDWLPELTYILKGEETRPITRLFVGVRFALGILFKARRIADQLDRAAVEAGEEPEGLVVPRQPRQLAAAGNLLVALSGARPEILDRCPSERSRFEALGWSVLMTSAMAAVSMWFALTSAMGINPFGALPVAVVWGLGIMGVDRWLIISMPFEGKRKLLGAVPRLMLALLVGSIISTPIVLRIFEPEINGQISVIQTANQAAFLRHEQHSSVQAGVTQWQSTVNDLEQVIASGSDPATDPTVVRLTSQLRTEQATAGSDYQDWQCQLYGGCGSSAANGLLAQASEKRYDNDEAETAVLNSEIQARESQLNAANASSQSQARAALPPAQAQLAVAEREADSLTWSFDSSTNNASNGLLIRLDALSQLSAADSAVQAGRLLLFLLFLIIDVLPVTVRLLQPQGIYEKLLRRQIAHELYQAEWELRHASRG